MTPAADIAVEPDGSAMTVLTEGFVLGRRRFVRRRIARLEMLVGSAGRPGNIGRLLARPALILDVHQGVGDVRLQSAAELADALDALRQFKERLLEQSVPRRNLLADPCLMVEDLVRGEAEFESCSRLEWLFGRLEESGGQRDVCRIDCGGVQPVLIHCHLEELGCNLVLKRGSISWSPERLAHK